MTQEEGMLRYEAGHYELHGYPLRPGDVIEVLTGSGWIPGYLAYERGGSGLPRVGAWSE